MGKLVKYKWLIFVLIIVSVLIFDAIVYNVAIDDRGMVLGLGIDVEGDEILVSAQILLQKNGGVSSGGSKYVTINGKDKTIKGAYSQISDKLGMDLSLAHTMIIIISRQIVAHDKVYLIKSFLTDDEVSDLTGLVMAEGSPKDILDAKIAYGEIASLQLQRIVAPQRSVLGITSSNIMNFAVAYFAPNTACAMPLVHKIKADPNSEQASNQVKEAEQLIVNRTAVVTKDGTIIELEQDANEGYSLVRSAVKGGTISIMGDDNRPVGVQIFSSTCSPKYSIDDMSVTYNFSIKCMRGSGRIDETGNISYLLSDKEKERFSQAINQRVKEAWEVSQQNNADFWRIYEGFYQRYGKKWTNKISGDYLGEISIKTNVKISQR